MPKILILDDDVAVTTSLSLLLRHAGFEVISLEDPSQILPSITGHSIDLVIMDMNFSMETSGEEGLALLQEIKESKPELPVVLITAWGSISLAVQGLKTGAADFITKPWNNEHLIQSVNTALSLSKGTSDQHPPNLDRDKLDKKYDFDNIIGRDPGFLTVLETIGRVAGTEASILIVGESGTGKELIAEAVHLNSERRGQAFIKVNLGGISRSLFESEMFGHKKGAFTDAKHDRVGRFELAHRGTIFLDEIGEIDLSSQVKLLRVLQDRSFEVLGSSKTRTVDFRVVSATNRPLETLVENGEFREDLFYRINLITVKLPSLRERPGDIPLLVSFFIDNLRGNYGNRKIEVSKAAMDWLKALPWPGNIRELKNLVERTILVTQKTKLDVDDFAAQLNAAPVRSRPEELPAVGTMTLDEIEKQMIQKALVYYEDNLSQVAKSLGLSRGALYRKLEKYGLSR